MDTDKKGTLISVIFIAVFGFLLCYGIGNGIQYLQGGKREARNLHSIIESVPQVAPEQVIPVEQLSFVQNAYSIHIGEVVILEVIITPDAATTPTITWKSSNISIADVDQNGYVVGVGEGTAIITAESDNGIVAEANVSVVPSSVPIIEVNQVTLSKKSMRMKVGESETLQATISPKDATYRTLIWSSSNSSIVTVNESGKIVAIREGTATITVKSSNGKSDSIAVTVGKSSSHNVDVTSISLSKNNITLEIGQTETITATVNPKNATVQALTWTSSNPAVATVTDGGKIKAVQAGTTIVTARSVNGMLSSVYVTVISGGTPIVEVTGVVLSKTSTILEEGQTEVITASVQPANATNQTITFSSSDSSVVMVNQRGVITAMKAGSATIIAQSYNGKNSRMSVAVTKKSSPDIAVSGITLSKTSVSLEVGQTETVSASVQPSNATNQTITWASSNAAVATVTQTGKITAISKGTATIIVKSNNGKTASLIVTVNKSEIDVTSVVVSTNNVQLEVGGSTTVTASVRPSNATNPTITWKSNDTSIATVNANGKIIGVKAGTTTVIAKSNNGKSASVSVSVIKKGSLVEVTGVVLSKTSLALVVGGTEQIIATITPSNATNPSITWYSDTPSVATVDGNGNVTAVGAGKATITAQSNNGKKASAVVTVTAPVIPIAANGKINNEYFHITEGDNVEKAIAAKNSKGISEAIQYASINGIRNIYIAKGTYMVANIVDDKDNNNNAAIRMYSNVDFDLHGSTIKLFTNYDPKYAVVYFQNVTNSTIRNGRLVGDRETHRCNSSGNLIDSYHDITSNMCGSSHGGTHEWGFGIKILASSNIHIEDMNISYMTGDGIYMRMRGSHTGSYPTDQIYILRNKIHKCRRQGISIVSGTKVTIDNNQIYDIHGASPQLGIDLEPNQDFDVINHITITNNRIYSLGNGNSISTAGRTGPITGPITITDNYLSAAICIDKPYPKLSGNKRINNQGNSASGNWNTNCPY